MDHLRVDQQRQDQHHFRKLTDTRPVLAVDRSSSAQQREQLVVAFSPHYI